MMTTTEAMEMMEVLMKSSKGTITSEEAADEIIKMTERTTLNDDLFKLAVRYAREGEKGTSAILLKLHDDLSNPSPL